MNAYISFLPKLIYLQRVLVMAAGLRCHYTPPTTQTTTPYTHPERPLILFCPHAVSNKGCCGLSDPKTSTTASLYKYVLLGHFHMDSQFCYCSCWPLYLRPRWGGALGRTDGRTDGRVSGHCRRWRTGGGVPCCVRGVNGRPNIWLCVRPPQTSLVASLVSVWTVGVACESP